ncbi:MAG: hypothetical protein JNN25_06665 [Candidatus Kapabacteria bacterium]|nr:hypothetical protein [Candidatus Kapabacteria bacterium]
MKTSNDSVISKILKIKGLYKLLKVMLKDTPYNPSEIFAGTAAKARHSPLLRRTAPTILGKDLNRSNVSI